MLPHTLRKLEVRVLEYLEENADKNEHNLIFEHTFNFTALNLLTCCFNFLFLLNILWK